MSVCVCVSAPVCHRFGVVERVHASSVDFVASCFVGTVADGDSCGASVAYRSIRYRQFVTIQSIGCVCVCLDCGFVCDLESPGFPEKKERKKRKRGRNKEKRQSEWSNQKLNES